MSVTGFVPDVRLPLACSTIYCHISYQEGMPIALLEAMALGRCVLAVPVGGIPEVLDGTNGRLVASGPHAVAEGVLRFLANRAVIERLGAAAAETIRRGYTWEARIPQVLSIYGAGAR